MNPIHYSMWFQGSGFSRCAWWMNHRHYLERMTSWWWMMGEQLLDTIGCIRHDIFCHGILFNPNHNPAYRIVTFPAGSNTLTKHCPLLLWFETILVFPYSILMARVPIKRLRKCNTCSSVCALSISWVNVKWNELRV
jgi:hypothetical protein